MHSDKGDIPHKPNPNAIIYEKVKQKDSAPSTGNSPNPSKTLYDSTTGTDELKARYQNETE